MKTKVIYPLLTEHTLNESNIVEYLDVFGCCYLSDTNLASYLSTIRRLSIDMKHTVFHALLLYYASKSLLFWVMARPREYIKLYDTLLHVGGNNIDP